MSREPGHWPLDVWPLTVWCASTKGQLRKVAKALGIEGQIDGAGNAGRTFSHLGPLGFHVIVWVDAKHQTGRELVDTCAHEASHVVDGLFEYVEEERPGAETRAYLVGWLTRQLLEHCDPAP